MERLRQKRPRLVLERREYSALRNRILDRDGWKCQSCGSSLNLQIHHLIPRSKLGPDASENLITLCNNCHTHYHNLRDALVNF